MENTTELPILEAKVLDALDAIQPGLVKELIQLFFVQVKEESAKLETGLAKSDWEQIWQTAHNMKSAAGNLGALKFAESCMKVEKLCRYQKPTTELVRELLDQLKAQEQSLEPVLKKRLSA